MKINIWIPIALVVLGLVLSACTEQAQPVNQQPAPPANNGQQNTQTTPTPPPAEPPKPVTPPIMDPRLKIFNITAKQFAFEPDTIQVVQGDKVRIYLTSADVAHGFAIFQPGAYENVSFTVDAGKTTMYEFNATTPGIYTFKCNVICGPGHASMQGKFIVLKPSEYKGND